MVKKKPDIRFLNDMKEVLYDQKWAKTAPNFELYYMYRGLKKQNGLRYDITVIPARMLGKEFVKTKGHHHKHQELYEVLKGEAIFFMQKGDKNLVKDALAIKAKKGEVVILPPLYDHTTINPAKTELKIANWLSEKCQYVYSFFEKAQGACYYYTKDGWIKNKKYKKVPKLHFKKPLKKVLKDLSFLHEVR